MSLYLERYKFYMRNYLETLTKLKNQKSCLLYSWQLVDIWYTCFELINKVHKNFTTKYSELL